MKEQNMTSDSKCSAPEIHLLGEIVVLFGNLELILEMAVLNLLAAEENECSGMAQFITVDMSFARKIKALSNMFDQKGIDGAKSELKILVEQLRKAEEERNSLIHSAWNYTSIWGGWDLTRMKSSRRKDDLYNRRVCKMSIEDIKAARDLIAAASDSLMRFTFKYIQAPDPEDKMKQEGS